MGKVKELLSELAETFQDMLWHTGTWGRAIDNMKQILPPDEFNFFKENIDVIKEMISMDDDSYPNNDEKDYDQYELGPGDGGMATFRKKQEDEKPPKRFRRMPESLEMPPLEKFMNNNISERWDAPVDVNGNRLKPGQQLRATRNTSSWGGYKEKGIRKGELVVIAELLPQGYVELGGQHSGMQIDPSEGFELW